MLKLAPQHTIVDAVGSFDRLDVGLPREPARHPPALGPQGPARTARAGVRRPDRRRADERTSSGCSARSAASWWSTRRPTSTTSSSASSRRATTSCSWPGMDIPNIKNVKIGLQTLRLLNTPMKKIHLILNRANSKVKLEVSEVERTLQVKADALIPSRHRGAAVGQQGDPRRARRPPQLDRQEPRAARRPLRPPSRRQEEAAGCCSASPGLQARPERRSARPPGAGRFAAQRPAAHTERDRIGHWR